MVQNAHTGKRFDAQTYLIRVIKNIVLVSFVGLVVKYTLFDTTVIKNNQMYPGILHGDNVLVFRTLSLPAVRSLFSPAFNSPVIFSVPLQKGKRSCLRIAGRSGDTIEIDSGIFYHNKEHYRSLSKSAPNVEVLPQDYSPRDFFDAYIIPLVRDTILMDSLSIRAFFFTYSIISQESKASAVSFNVDLLLDDSMSNDYIINGFSLHSGAFKDISEPLKNEWFFWVQLKQYLKSILPDHTVEFRFTATQQNKSIRKYVVKELYVFLLADNWISGFDSRYFGPVKESSIFGRPFIVWWSNGKSGGLKSIRISRIGRMVL